MKFLIHVLLSVTIVVLFNTRVSSQNPTYYCDVRNGVYVGSDVFEFDLYMTRTGSLPLELACFNAGIKLSSGFVNGGTISVEIISDSDLQPAQVPTNVSYDDATACVQIAPKQPPRDYATGVTSGTIISHEAGSKLCGVRLTNSVSFGVEPATFTWSHSLDPYRTVVSAFVDEGVTVLNALITDSESNSHSAMATVFLEGLFFEGQNRKAQGEFGDQYGGPVSDQISISLADANSPYDIVYTVNSVNLHTNGKVSFQVPIGLKNAYYIVVNNRNSLETWSSVPVSFNGAVDYDFTNDMASAYANNMIEVFPGQWALFAGDVSQDGVIDSDDFIEVDNGSFNYLFGYLAADVNGDGVIDSGDFIPIDNNGFNYIGLARPY